MTRIYRLRGDNSPIIFYREETAMETRVPTEEETAAMIADWHLARMKPRQVDKPGWGHPVMMLLYAVLLIVVGFLLRGAV